MSRYYRMNPDEPIRHDWTGGRKSSICKFCCLPVNLDDEGAQYKDGTCAHDHCHDGHEFETANQADFRD